MTTSAHKKIIIFDLDGVLFDSAKYVSDFFLHTYPTLTKEIMSEMLCGNFHVELDKFKLHNKPIEETPAEKDSRGKVYSEQKQKAPLYEGIYELLDQLHQKGYTLVINTSALEKNCKPLLEYSDVARFFDFIATKETSPSKEEKFHTIAKKYSVPNDHMLFVTDTLGDIREADLAGVPTIAVTWGAHDRSYFGREPHTNLIDIVDSVDELKDLLTISS